MKTTIILLSFFILTQMGCNKADDAFVPTLPPITQTGENTFGCYIDGKLLTPRDGTGTFNVPDRGMRFIAGGIPPDVTYNEIKIRDFVGGNGSLLTFHIKDLHQIKESTYTISNSNCEDGVDSVDNVNLFCRWRDEATQTLKWYCSIENGGSLTITRYDFENKIVAGTFSCTLVNRDNPTDFIEITQGRFDINWDTLRYTNFP